MNWRTWIFAKLTNDAGVTALVPANSIYGAGALDVTPANKPFIIIDIGPVTRGPFPGALVNPQALLWIHDEPGDFLRIDDTIAAVKSCLVGTGDRREAQVPDAGGLAIRWQGDSGELADEGFRTIVRNSGYQLNGNGG